MSETQILIIVFYAILITLKIALLALVSKHNGRK